MVKSGTRKASYGRGDTSGDAKLWCRHVQLMQRKPMATYPKLCPILCGREAYARCCRGDIQAEAAIFVPLRQHFLVVRHTKRDMENDGIKRGALFLPASLKAENVVAAGLHTPASRDRTSSSVRRLRSRSLTVTSCRPSAALLPDIHPHPQHAHLYEDMHQRQASKMSSSQPASDSPCSPLILISVSNSSRA